MWEFCLCACVWVCGCLCVVVCECVHIRVGRQGYEGGVEDF